MFVLAQEHYADNYDEFLYEFIGMFDSFSGMENAVGKLSVNNHGRHCYCELTETNKLFSNLEYTPIETPSERKLVADRAAEEKLKKELKEREELVMAKRRALQVEQMEKWRNDVNVDGFSDAVPMAVIEYCNDLHSDVSVFLQNDGDPYFRSKESSLMRRLAYYKRAIDYMREKMTSSLATQEDVEIFNKISKEASKII